MNQKCKPVGMLILGGKVMTIDFHSYAATRLDGWRAVFLRIVISLMPPSLR